MGCLNFYSCRFIYYTYKYIANEVYSVVHSYHEGRRAAVEKELTICCVFYFWLMFILFRDENLVGPI